MAQGRGEAVLGFGSQKSPLVLLLREVAADIKGMKGAAMARSPVGCSAVPEVGVIDDDGSGWSGDESFLRMRVARVLHLTLRESLPLVRAGDDAGSAVV